MYLINLVNNQLNKLIQRNNHLKNFFNYDKNKNYLLTINTKLESPKIWNHTVLLLQLKKKQKKLRTLITNLDKIQEEISDLAILITLASETNDFQLLNQIINEINFLNKKIDKLEFYKMFSKKNDKLNCYLDLQSGSGGTESQDWAQTLLRMYLKWAENKGFKTDITDETPGDIAGIKSSTLHIIGDYAFGWLRTETGIHRLVRKSPFDSSNRRHTSFTSVFIYPDIEDNIDIAIIPSELRIDVYKASGAGGQHVNRTESAVRITHIPSNVVTQCQSGRSQHKNKEQALKQMKSKLYEMAIKKKKIRKKLLENKKSNIGWGHQIRSYILDDSRIKDLRTGLEIRNIQSVLNGYIDPFIIANLQKDHKE